MVLRDLRSVCRRWVARARRPLPGSGRVMASAEQRSQARARALREATPRPALLALLHPGRSRRPTPDRSTRLRWTSGSGHVHGETTAAMLWPPGRTPLSVPAPRARRTIAKGRCRMSPRASKRTSPDEPAADVGGEQFARHGFARSVRARDRAEEHLRGLRRVDRVVRHHAARLRRPELLHELPSRPAESLQRDPRRRGVDPARDRSELVEDVRPVQPRVGRKDGEARAEDGRERRAPGSGPETREAPRRAGRRAGPRPPGGPACVRAPRHDPGPARPTARRGPRAAARPGARRTRSRARSRRGCARSPAAAGRGRARSA